MNDDDDEDTLAGDVRDDGRCDVCDLFGPLQCHEHGDAELACARAYGEHHETIAALRGCGCARRRPTCSPKWRRAVGSAGSPYRTAEFVVPPPPPKRWYVRQFGPYGAFNVPVGVAIGATIGEIARHAGILDWPIVALSIPAAFVFWWRRAAEKPADGVLSRWIHAPLPWRPRE